MPKLHRDGELLTVFTDYDDVYEYLFDDIRDAIDAAENYIKCGCQVSHKTVYSPEA